MSVPAVSIIIPCFNSSKTITDTLNSVLMQTLQGWEALVINDGSTDSSLERIKSFCQKDPRIKLISQKNQGVAEARNSGIKMAQGEYIIFLDADDLLFPRMLDRTVRMLRKNTDCGVAYCDWITSDYNLVNMIWTNSFIGKRNPYSDLVEQNRFQPNVLLIRRNVVDELGGFDVTLPPCEDWDMWIRIARQGVGFIRVPEALALYRMTPGSMSRKVSKGLKGGLAVIERGFAPDPRVKNPDPEFAKGSDPSRKNDALFNWSLQCCASALTGGEEEMATTIFDEAIARYRKDPTPAQVLRPMKWALWFGGGTLIGDWSVFSQRFGLPLIRFLLKVESRLERPGFAMEFLNQFMPRTQKLGGQQIMRLLLDRAMAKYFDREKDRRAKRMRDEFISALRSASP
ncbi:MAG: glycosyltransferase [Chlamydiota bacterium]|nr:glycosyltransferase [Chlamydiota bacterium]